MRPRLINRSLFRSPPESAQRPRIPREVAVQQIAAILAAPQQPPAVATPPVPVLRAVEVSACHCPIVPMGEQQSSATANDPEDVDTWTPTVIDFCGELSCALMNRYVRMHQDMPRTTTRFMDMISDLTTVLDAYLQLPTTFSAELLASVWRQAMVGVAKVLGRNEADAVICGSFVHIITRNLPTPEQRMRALQQGQFTPAAPSCPLAPLAALAELASPPRDEVTLFATECSPDASALAPVRVLSTVPPSLIQPTPMELETLDILQKPEDEEMTPPTEEEDRLLDSSPEGAARKN